MKKKALVTALIVLLTLMVFSQIISLNVNAIDVKITSISPSTRTGKVGDNVTIVGTLNTTNGAYHVWFGSRLIVNGTASENNVNCSFTVPTLPNGNYTITLQDITANANATSWFLIQTAYHIKVTEITDFEQLQEGETVNISISITGGKANTIYKANVTVKTPNADEVYSKIVSLTNTTDIGIANTTLIYPSAFGTNAHTNYTGTYTIYFNSTLASKTFFVGITDRKEYHRGDQIKIRAVGYLGYANVNITVKSGTNIIDEFAVNVTDGIVSANWTVLNSVTVGNYSLSITPVPTSKKVNDTQTFAVPGFKTTIVPRNLASEAVSNVLLRVYDKEANKTYEVTSNNGAAKIQLEIGEYNSTAYFKKVKVGEIPTFNVTGELELNITCQLTNLKITVISEQNTVLKIPFVLLNVTYAYTTELNGEENKNETTSAQTDITGTAMLSSFLLNASYTVNASRYGQVFNQNNNTLSSLEPLAWNDIVIMCPEKTLYVNVVDANSQPITNAKVEATEFMGGLRYSDYTTQNGNVTLNCIIGVYRVRVYYNGVFLNEGTVELFNENTTTIRCSLYNLPIFIKVVDYFGQPIPKVNVVLERNGVQIGSKLTEADGIAEFTEIGGELTIKVYLANQDQPIAAFKCSILEARNEANPLTVKIGSYIVLAGFLVETAQFTTIILIVAALVLFAVIEIVRRRRFKKVETEAEA